MSFIKIIFIILVSSCTFAYIFDDIDDTNDKTKSLVNFDPNFECHINETIYNQIIDIRINYQKLKEFTDDEIIMINNENFKDILPKVCESKRDLARSVTDTIIPITQICVQDIKMAKSIGLNTLLMLQIKLEFICNMSETIFDVIYKKNAINCINQRMSELGKCRKNSFKNLFFMKPPEKLYWLQLINGNVCNFKFGSMLACAESYLKDCDGAIEVLSYLFDVIKNISICYKRKDVSEINDNL